MLVIYHSREALPARHAAALHLGWLPMKPPSDRLNVAAIWERLGGLGTLAAQGLWFLGEDPAGRRVFALGRASRPEVVSRAFEGITRVWVLERRAFILQSVEPVAAWTDLVARCAHQLGLDGLAWRFQCRCLRRGWGAANAAVQHLRARLGSGVAMDR